MADVFPEYITRISYAIFIVLVIAIFAFYIYDEIYDKPKSEKENYIQFSKELSDDMHRYGIKEADKLQIEKIVGKIVEKKKKEKTVKELVNVCKSGLIRGCIFGFLGGGVEGAIASGTMYSLVNGIMQHFFE